MSINWHYFKAMNRVPTVTIPKAASGTIKDLYDLTGFKADTRQYGQSGRPWRAEELRLKNHDDLHKLWYVLLKEKNKLKSDRLVSMQLNQQFYGFSDIVKVRVSMARLLTVVNERKKLRNEYRRHLEDEYITVKKAEEHAAQVAEYEKLKEKGVKPPMTPEELKELLISKSAKKTEALKIALELVKESAEKDDTTTAPLLNESDLQLISTTKVNLSQGDILRLYVKNWAELDLRQRRRVMGHINAQRAMHAKEVFLKELSAIGRKLGKQTDAADTKSRIKNKKDPLKLRLEGLTAVEAAATN